MKRTIRIDQADDAYTVHAGDTVILNTPVTIVADLGPMDYRWPDDSSSVQIRITEEGVIIDAYRGDQLIGTEAATFGEMYERMIG